MLCSYWKAEGGESACQSTAHVADVLSPGRRVGAATPARAQNPQMRLGGEDLSRLPRSEARAERHPERQRRALGLDGGTAWGEGLSELERGSSDQVEAGRAALTARRAGVLKGEA